jgi:hypothetical protein
MKNKLDFRAIMIGSIVDLLSSTLFAFLFFNLAGIDLISRGLTELQMQDHIAHWIKSSEGFGYMLFFGLCFTFFGGHIAMKVSKRKSLYNALFVGVVSIISSAFTGDNGTIVQTCIVYLLPIPAALLGGYNYLRRWTF